MTLPDREIASQADVARYVAREIAREARREAGEAPSHKRDSVYLSALKAVCWGLEAGEGEGEGEGSAPFHTDHDDLIRKEHLQVDPMDVPAERRRAALRSLVPYELSRDVCLAIEEFDGHVRDHEPAIQQATLGDHT